MRKLLTGFVCTALMFCLGIVHIQQASAADTQDMYRLYNPESGEHFYTGNLKERNALIGYGWRYEGVGWKAPVKSDVPVYRLYNKNGGEHTYTTSVKEKDALIQFGWKDEGIGWYSDSVKKVKLYREYNPNAFANNHNYTTSEKEHKTLISYGWSDEGIGWYGVSAGHEDHSTGDAELDEYCDEILQEIIKPSMSKRDKAYAIYCWVEDNIRYKGNSAHDNWIAGAKDALTMYRGDCYAFYSSARALLEKAGFETMEVSKESKGHYWVLVKFEGKWLHFDCTTGWGTQRFLWTNKQILKYKYYNKHLKTTITYNGYDPSKYPAE